jgi:long-chain acyl-CoA synthetase
MFVRPAYVPLLCLDYSVTGCLFVGECIVVQDNYTLGQAVDLIDKYQINDFFGVPTMMQMFLDDAPVERLKSLKFFISGGAPSAP